LQLLFADRFRPDIAAFRSGIGFRGLSERIDKRHADVETALIQSCNLTLAERTAAHVDETMGQRHSSTRELRQRLRHLFQHQRKKARAHELWEQAGKPEGSDEHFWFEAERQLKEEQRWTPEIL
jgi:hypothetical protein